MTIPGVTPLSAVPHLVGQPTAKSATTLEALRERIRSIERKPPALTSDPGQRHSAIPETMGRSVSSLWTLGAPAVDDRIGIGGLDIDAVHEIKPAVVAGWAPAQMSAIYFALALAVRRLRAVAGPEQDASPILFCTTTTQCAEIGSPYWPGLAALGLDPIRLIVVQAARQTDILWAVEEGLKSKGVALVLGQLDDVGLTPARRLALAAAATSTPCLLLTHPRSPPAAATGSRWRIAPAPSSPHALDEDAPGAARFHVSLERSRGAAKAFSSVPCLLEWCDVAYCFRVAAGVADEPARPRPNEGRPVAALDHGQRA